MNGRFPAACCSLAGACFFQGRSAALRELAGTLTRAVISFFGLRGRGTGTAFEAGKMNAQQLTPNRAARFFCEAV
jgi:hypothetical protein